jgi:hypothetical protein
MKHFVVSFFPRQDRACCSVQLVTSDKSSLVNYSPLLVIVLVPCLLSLSLSRDSQALLQERDNKLFSLEVEGVKPRTQCLRFHLFQHQHHLHYLYLELSSLKIKKELQVTN